MSATTSMTPLLDQRVVICCGSGGVGKTTIAASIALRAARAGKKVLALTIDPARRLADSMGVELQNEPTRVPEDIQSKMGIPDSGCLAAMMLDTKSTFDAMVHELAPSEEVRDQILSNRYYQQISQSMVGSQEYMAMTKLLDVFETGAYDLIVLDTPPSRHALDFLSAPQRLSAVLEEGALSWLIRKDETLWSRIGGGIAGRMKTILSKLEGVLGLNVIADLSDFVTSFQALLAGFREKAVRVDALLKSQEASFVLVASPDRTSLEEAAYFYDQLKARSLPFAGFVINRALPLSASNVDLTTVEAALAFEEPRWLSIFPSAPPPSLNPEDYQSLLLTLQARFGHIITLAEIDRSNLTDLVKRCPGRLGLMQIPELPEDVHDLDTLRLLGDLLLGTPG